MSKEKAKVNTLMVQKVLVDRLHASLLDLGIEIDKNTTQQIYKAYVKVISDAVCEGYKIQLPELCSISARIRPERTCQNPHTGDKITLKEALIPRFVPSSKIKASLIENKTLLKQFKAAESEKSKK